MEKIHVLETQIAQCKDPEEKINLHLQIADAWEEDGRIQKAIESSQKAIQILENPDVKQHQTQVQTYYKIAKRYRELGKYRETLSYYHKAIQVNSDIHADAHIDTALSHYYLASMLESLWRMEAATDHYKTALDIAEKTLGKDDANTQHLQKTYTAAIKKLENTPKQQLNSER